MSRLFQTFTIGGLQVAALSDGAPDRALGGFFAGVEPAAWTAARSSPIRDSKRPSVEGFVIITAAVFGPSAALNASRSTPPSSAEGIVIVL